MRNNIVLLVFLHYYLTQPLTSSNIPQFGFKVSDVYMAGSEGPSSSDSFLVSLFWDNTMYRCTNVVPSDEDSTYGCADVNIPAMDVVPDEPYPISEGCPDQSLNNDRRMFIENTNISSTDGLWIESFFVRHNGTLKVWPTACVETGLINADGFFSSAAPCTSFSIDRDRWSGICMDGDSNDCILAGKNISNTFPIIEIDLSDDNNLEGNIITPPNS